MSTHEVGWRRAVAAGMHRAYDSPRTASGPAERLRAANPGMKPAFSRMSTLVKRTIDIVGALVGLIVFGPLMLAIAVAIRLDSKGPVFFHQKRLGMGGSPFWMAKFRTMVCDAEQRIAELEHLNESEGGVLFKMKEDPRTTRLGRSLRQTSLDELPQFFNVLRGHMSLVGPRPLPLRDSDLLRGLDERGFAERLRVPPGVTGPWQVEGRSDVGIQHMLRFDLDYVLNWSLWLDIKIICRTFVVLLGRRGAC